MNRNTYILANMLKVYDSLYIEYYQAPCNSLRSKRIGANLLELEEIAGLIIGNALVGEHKGNSYVFVTRDNKYKFTESEIRNNDARELAEIIFQYM